MFHSFAIFRRKREASARFELPVRLRMRGRSEGETISTRTVVMALLWQRYGLDLRHPEVSRWLEQNAPDVKYAVAEDQFARGHNRTKFRVGPNGTIKVYLTLEVDDRLREVTSRYILRQVEHSMEPPVEHSTEPQQEQIEPELVEAIIAQATGTGLSMNDYLARLLGSTLQYNDELSLAEVRQEAETRRLATYELVAENFAIKKLRNQRLKTG